ncbi:MAG: crossover junction endodeoxyribonuclease RuvC [Nitriliruptoraceae bacterium]|nr:crossover junction endodeoxyribonuclease RuvC [Nitriliruptoraceae bacterium]
MRVLGVDPGLTRCGIGVVEGSASSPSLVDHGVIRTGTDLALEQRLLQVHDAIVAAIERHRPDAVAVERVLFSANVRTAMATGQAAGVALVAAARAGIPVTPYSPNQVKQTVAGSGSADKQAVGRLVAAQLRLDAPPRPADVADALAVALTHLAFSRLEQATGTSGAAAALRAAQHDAGRRTRGGWEAHLAARGLLPEPRR